MDCTTLEIVSDSESDCCSSQCSCNSDLCASCDCELELEENEYYDHIEDCFYCKKCWDLIQPYKNHD